MSENLPEYIINVFLYTVSYVNTCTTNLVFEAASQRSSKKDGLNVNMFLTFLFLYKVKFCFKDLYELLCSKENCDIMQRKKGEKAI